MRVKDSFIRVGQSLSGHIDLQFGMMQRSVERTTPESGIQENEKLYVRPNREDQRSRPWDFQNCRSDTDR
jgi:hypothetical protein